MCDFNDLSLLVVLITILCNAQIILTKLIQTPDVTYDNGDIHWTSTFQQRTFHSYIGIPYAEPPIGPLRFKLPQKSTLKGNIYVGTDSPTYSSTCTQMDMLEVLDGQEDCLHLHVYVPNTTPKQENKKLPIIFWIHGGGFFAGSGSPKAYGPEHFMDYDVILVAINYRVGPLAFLTLENDLMPGNLGIHDQILALKWTQDNIEYFGGDPGKVTIMGESAGAMSVMYLMMSEQAKHLFHGAIIQSGPIISSYTHWDKQPHVYTIRLAQDLGCKNVEDNKKIVDCLRKIDAFTYANHTKHFLHYPWIGPNVWKPYVDGTSDDISNPLFMDEPINLLKTGQFNKVPVIIGTNSDEGAINSIGFLDGRASFDEINDSWNDSIGPLILFHRSFDETMEEDKEMAKNIKEMYFQQENISKQNLNEFIKLSGDHMFYGGTELVVEELNKNNVTTFRYMYNHKGTVTLPDIFLLNRMVFLGKLAGSYLTGGWKMVDLDMGVCHSDEIFVMFRPQAIPINILISEADKRASQRMLSYYANFATNHNPNIGIDVEVPWIPSSSPNFDYLTINGEETSPLMGYDSDFKSRSDTWSKYHKHLLSRYTYNGLSSLPPLTSSEAEKYYIKNTVSNNKIEL